MFRKVSNGRTLASNTVWNLVGNAAPMAFALVCIPALLSHLGTARFGLLTLVWMLVGYFSLFDFGFGRALTQAIAARIGIEEHSNILEIARHSIALMLAFAAGTGFVMAAMAPWIVRSVLKIPLELQQEARLSFILLAVATPATVATVGLQGLLAAYQRFDLINCVRIPLGVFTFGGAVMVLPFSHSLVPITFTLVIGRYLALVASWLLTKKVIKGFTFTTSIRFSVLRPLMSFAGWMSISNLLSPLMTYMDRFFVGSVLSVTAVAFYSTPYEVVTRLTLLPVAIAGTTFPTFAALLRRDTESARGLLRKASTVSLLVLFPVLLICTAFGRFGLTLWLGSEFARQSTPVLQWLAVGVLLNGIAQIAYAFVQGTGRADVTAKLHALEFPIYFPTLIWLLHHYGIVGAAIAWTLRAAIDCIALFVACTWLAPIARDEKVLTVQAVISTLLLLWGAVSNPVWSLVGVSTVWYSYELLNFLVKNNWFKAKKTEVSIAAVRSVN